MKPVCRKPFMAAIMILYLIISIPCSAPAQEDRQKRGADQELSDLLGVTIEAASRKEESVLTAPGVVSVLTADEIKELGIHSVAEAVGFITGVFLYDSYLANYNQLAIRGNFGAEHYNSKILFMVNGHPVYYTVHGGFEVNMIPLEAVARIEVVRGPVSVMYGTNALTGVINIITYKEAPFLNGEVRYHYGSFGTHELRFSSGKEIQKFKYFLSASLRRQDGYDLVVRPDQDEARRGLAHKQYANLKNLFLSVQYEDVEADLAYWSQQHPSKIGIIPNSLFKNDIFDQSVIFADIRYARRISRQAVLHFKLRMDWLDYYWEPEGVNLIDRTAASPSIATAENSKYGAEAYADYDVTGNLNLLAGILYDNYYSSPYTFTSWTDPTGANFSPYKEEKNTSDLAAYANFNFQATSRFVVVGGLRRTQNSASGGHTDYRLGSIITVRENLSLKALYGTSYRSPNFFELFCVSRPILQGNEDLHFETLNGLDLSVNYNYRNKLLTSVTYFWNKTDDFITRRTVAGVPTYVNVAGYEAQGFEWELKYNPSKRFSMFCNAVSIIASHDKETEQELQYMVTGMLNFGLSFKPTDDIAVSCSNSYRSSWADSKAFFLTNLAVYYKLPGYQPATEVFLTVNNLLDKEYTFAEFSRRSIATIPGGPPRSVTAGIILSF